jgi:hypothetical protein
MTCEGYVPPPGEGACNLRVAHPGNNETISTAFVLSPRIWLLCLSFSPAHCVQGFLVADPESAPGLEGSLETWGDVGDKAEERWKGSFEAT